MKKTFTVLLLCVLASVLLLCGCNKKDDKGELESDIIKMQEIREEEDKLTVVYEDGYELSYSFRQPIEVFDQKDGTRAARAIGTASLQIIITNNSSTGGAMVVPNGGITIETGEYNATIGTGDYVYSTGVVTGNGENFIYQFQSTNTPRYIEHNGKKYADCSDELLRRFRAATTLLDFVTGYEKEPFDSIYESGFTKFESLEAIILPTSIKEIGQKAFDGCQKLTTVYFCGTEEEWGTVKMEETEVKDKDGKEVIETTPNHLASCTVYFYSEEEPTAAGNYWHYVDGTPIQWQGEAK